jgi:hypothetical protein
METTSLGTIRMTNEKQLVRASDNQPFTLYEFETHPLGRMTTTKKALYDQVQGLLNVPLLLAYTEKQNGQFTNRYLNRVELAAQQPLAQTETAQAITSYNNEPIGRDEAIWRQTATKVAAGFNNKDLAQYWDRVEMLILFYRTGVIPSEEEPPAPVMPGPGTFIPPAPMDMEPAAAVTDDDIPF